MMSTASQDVNPSNNAKNHKLHQNWEFWYYKRPSKDLNRNDKDGNKKEAKIE